MFSGGSKKNDPVQTLSGSTSSRHPGEVVVLNVDALMDAGWNLRGDAYQALLWGAMTARVKGILGAPPSKELRDHLQQTASMALNTRVSGSC